MRRFFQKLFWASKEDLMAIADQLTQLNQNLTTLNQNAQAVIDALKAAQGNQAPAGLEQSLADANSAILTVANNLNAAATAPQP